MTGRPDERALVDLGLYDPEAPDAAERRALLDLAFDHGASIEEVREAIDERRLHAVAVIRVIEDVTDRLTLADVAERAGVSVEFARRVWRAFGLPDPEPGAHPCSERDIGAVAALALLRDQIGEDAAFQLARTMGASMSRVADTAVAMVRSLAEAPVRTAGGGNLEVAHELIRAAESFMPASVPVMDALLRHHVATAGRRYALWGVRPTEAGTTDAVVGFVDLVGFTTLGQQLDATELDALLRRFEDRALDASRRPLARLVKLIGDEAMFVAGGLDDAMDIVTTLTADPALPPMRAGLAAGVLVLREGDVYGPVVNLAARLVALAEPGEVLLDAEAALRLGPARVESLGSRVLPGFDEPVEIFAASP